MAPRRLATFFLLGSSDILGIAISFQQLGIGPQTRQVAFCFSRSPKKPSLNQQPP
jgi:hypothetical protein